MHIQLFRLFALFLMFGLGWMLNEYVTIDLEQPRIITGNAAYWPVVDQLSPSDIIQQEQIQLFEDRVVIWVENPQWATFTDTKSMDPVLDTHAYALQIIPKQETQIGKGDIISYRTTHGVIIHRVIDIGYDDLGWYAITKGDNNPVPDSEKVRFEQVQKMLFGILY